MLKLLRIVPWFIFLPVCAQRPDARGDGPRAAAPSGVPPPTGGGGGPPPRALVAPSSPLATVMDADGRRVTVLILRDAPLRGRGGWHGA